MSNAVYAIAILDLFSRVFLVSFVIMLPKVLWFCHLCHFWQKHLFFPSKEPISVRPERWPLALHNSELSNAHSFHIVCYVTVASICVLRSEGSEINLCRQH
jgi:hypothetical protein